MTHALNEGTNTKPVNLALQGGGAHGAFSWGVLDKLLEDGRIGIDAISGTSAGAMNAAVMAYGLMRGGRDGARAALEQFWRDIAETGRIWAPVKTIGGERSLGFDLDEQTSFFWFDAFTRLFSPYQFNPYDVNPLRRIIERNVDFAELQCCTETRLFISATNVRTGAVRVFKTNEVTVDVVMASACLPFLFKAVEIGGEHYWDGGYMGNPVLFPFFYDTASNDVVVVHVNPIIRPQVPTTSSEILNRVNEISFNSSLLREFRAISFVQRMIDEGWLREEFADRLRYVRVHSVRADEVMCGFSVASKYNTDWTFLSDLKERGRQTAEAWLAAHYDDVGHRSSVDLREEFLSISG